MIENGIMNGFEGISKESNETKMKRIKQTKRNIYVSFAMISQTPRKNPSNPSFTAKIPESIIRTSNTAEKHYD